MRDIDDLLRAVCDSPADDTPRLVLADALDDSGEENDRLRADFIRTQVKLARLPGLPLVLRGELLEINQPTFGAESSSMRGKAHRRYFNEQYADLRIRLLPELIPPGLARGSVVDYDTKTLDTEVVVSVRGGVVRDIEVPADGPPEARVTVRATGHDGYQGDRAELDRLRAREFDLYQYGLERWFEEPNGYQRWGFAHEWVDTRVRRGFVAELKTDCYTFMTGPAQEKYVLHQPIELVQLTDRSPARYAGLAYYWANGFHADNNAAAIPGVLFDLLDGYLPVDKTQIGWPNTGRVYYRHYHEAVAALSRAALRHARRKAGLSDTFPRHEPPT